VKSRSSAGPHADEHVLDILGKGSIVCEGTILGNTAHFASAHPHRRAPLGDHPVRQWNSSASRTRRPITASWPASASDPPTASGLLSDTAFGVSASRPLLAPRRERDQLGCREVPGRAYFGVQTLRAVENFAISGVALRDFSRFIDAFAFVKKAAARANAELGVLSEDSATRSRRPATRSPPGAFTTSSSST
jgi:aspartate ammonia-lyase